MQLAKETAASIYEEAESATSFENQAKLKRHAEKSESEHALKAMVAVAADDPRILVKPELLDADPWLFNCLNGTLELQTGKCREHSPSDLITKTAPISCSSQAECPAWDRFIQRIMGGSNEMVSYLKRVVGYTLTGLTTEQCLFILLGTGANGKTTFIEVIRRLMGEYARQTDINAFLTKKLDPIRNDIARLAGSRFVSSAEAPDGRDLDASLLKQLTGGDTVTSRKLYQESTEHKPSYKIFIVANRPPRLDTTDEAIWRRVQDIPFRVTIPEDERDPNLTETLAGELPGILRWAVEGSREWQRIGLRPPAEVRDATREHRHGPDAVGRFLKERCRRTPGAKIAVQALHAAYVRWCTEHREVPLEQKTFGNELRKRGLASGPGTGNYYYWTGLELKAEDVNDKNRRRAAVK
jgi:putative DNA primase/helicase